MEILHIWAKTSLEQNAGYHPLLCHMLDSAAVCSELLRERLSPAKALFFISNCIGGKEDFDIPLLAYICALHDIGKATPPFQEKSEKLKEILKRSGFNFPKTINPRHNYCSQKLLKTELRGYVNHFFDDSISNIIAEATGGHHGEFPDAIQMQSITPTVLGATEIWKEGRKQITQNLIEVLGLEKTNTRLSIKPGILPAVLRYWLTGLITLSDWIASMPEYFPFAGSTNSSEFSPANYYARSQKQAREALDQIRFLPYLDPGEPASFTELFNGFSPRKQQLTIIQAISELEKTSAPFFIVIEAPMGIGKTEAAFLASEIINYSTGQLGTYIAMPTQATSNQMFKRYNEFLLKRLPEQIQPESRLLHSASSLFLEQEAEKKVADYASNNRIDVVDWFLPKKRGLLSPFAVGTIDQLLLSVLATKHNYLRLFGLAAKTIIIDEVHSYDLYMSTILNRFLEWAAHLNISVILLSATLPRQTRENLVKAYNSTCNTQNVPYPRLTVASSHTNQAIPLNRDKSRTIQFSILNDPDDTTLFNTIGQKLEQGGCAAVICNTVRRAQQLYTDFRNAEEGKQIPAMLLHARFPAEHRLEIEGNLLNSVGKKASRPARLVVFSTQIIEQSLDLDFDYMISELCPIDLLLQRIGRLHRHIETYRPDGLQVPQITCIAPAWDNYLVNRVIQGPYEPYILYRSHLTLKNATGLMLPDDIELLIERVYGQETTTEFSQDEITTLQLLHKNHLTKQQEYSQAAEQRTILAPDKNIRENLIFLEDEDPSVHPALMAATRMGEPSVRAVIILAENEKEVFAVRNKYPFNPHEQISPDLLHVIQKATVTITGKMAANAVLSDKQTAIPAVWEKHAQLRFLRVIKFTNNELTLNNIKIFYNNELGISYQFIKESK
ncbi:MAG: CRISPR-associated helicase Cas3' [Ignavibacteria bacterium]|nr:CRISPR-associated helicase Cas3' [Ignavibacteria bacterium]